MKIRFISSNIWGDYFGNEVETREDQLFRVFDAYAPDVLGMQEATAAWNNSGLFSRLKETYDFADASAQTKNNFVPLCWRRNAFRLIESGYVQYADTPDPSKAATWAVLEDKASGVRFAAFSTHFWYKTFGDPVHDAIRVSNAREMTAQALCLREKYGVPVVAFGDLNSRYCDPAIAYLKENGWQLVRDTAAVTDETASHHGDPVRGEDGHYHGKTTENRYPVSIDHMLFLGDAVPAEFRVIVDQDALDATDHSPILGDLVIG